MLATTPSTAIRAMRSSPSTWQCVSAGVGAGTSGAGTSVGVGVRDGIGSRAGCGGGGRRRWSQLGLEGVQHRLSGRVTNGVHLKAVALHRRAAHALGQLRGSEDHLATVGAGRGA